MSRALFSLNPDLARLRSEGYFMRVQGSLLVMLEVPYVNAQRQVRFGPDIINNSWGSDDGTSVSYQHALRNMDAMGIINVFAAGNDGEAGRGTIGSPGSNASHIITVGATDRNDQPASASDSAPNSTPAFSSTPWMRASATLRDWYTIRPWALKPVNTNDSMKSR